MRTLELTREQEELRDAVRAVLARHPGHTAWAPLTAQIGAAALAVPEEYGGLGCGPAEVGVVMAELGRALSPVPYLGSAVLTVAALLASGDREACAKHLPHLAEGTVVGALAWAEASSDPLAPGAGWEPGDLSARAEPAGADWLLTGTKRYVLAGPAEPSLLLAFAWMDPAPGPATGPDTGSGVGADVERGADADRTTAPGTPVPPGQGLGVRRLGLFELLAAPAAFTVRSTMDRTRPLAELTLDRTPARLLSADGAGVLARVRDLACTALAAEQAGAAARALEVTVRYAKERVQFGRPIGSFQAVKHRLADLHTAVEGARSLALAAAAADAAPEAAAAAKSACSEASAYVAGEVIQLHGGIGITWEHEAHEYFKRAHGSALLFGSPAAHRERLAARLGFLPNDVMEVTGCRTLGP
ncbi:acyl-CoA dehydrogenase family protein [Streptomyces sp. NBC_00347]|uniref:acyl-CoA dehydrogenase family protein n=1 Tax=Streptomyces sp. NBC_00347 TaxID=2975721 RepID=UPI002B1E5C8D|nr:acyl-CoA dehydrogenase family protein [Streptomyces sp. NBC_00347]